MRAPYRIASPPEPEGPDPVDEYEAFLRVRGSRGRRLISVGCGVVAATTMLALAEVPPSRTAQAETPEMRAVDRIATARREISRARQASHEEQVRFDEALGRAIASSSTAEAEPCAVPLPEATRLLRGGRAFPLLVSEPGGALATFPSPSLGEILADVHRAEERLDSGRFADGIMYANALAVAFDRSPGKTPRLRWDVVLVTTSLKRPVQRGPNSFEPGEIVGRAYVYDFAEHRVRCAGDVRAASSPSISYAYNSGESTPVALGQGRTLDATLEADLEVQTQRAIAHGALMALR